MSDAKDKARKAAEDWVKSLAKLEDDSAEDGSERLLQSLVEMCERERADERAECLKILSESKSALGASARIMARGNP